MKPSGFYIVLTAFTVLLLFFNCLISRDINEWIPTLKERITLYLLVWLLPVAGFFLANKFGKLGWFSTVYYEREESSVTGGLLGLDEVFNPSTKHVIETIEEHKSEIRQESGQSDDKDKNSSLHT